MRVLVACCLLRPRAESLGLTDPSLRSNGQLSFAGASCAVTVSHTQATCQSAPGVGAGHAFTISVESLASAASSPSGSYIAPAITSIAFTPGTMRTSGDETVTLTGSNFGPSGTSARQFSCVIPFFES